MLALKKESETMSSTQLAELLHFESKSSLNKAIRLMFQDKINDSIIESSKDSRGYVIDYHLPELESKMFVAKHNIEFLEKITKFWIDRDKSSEKEKPVALHDPVISALVSSLHQLDAVRHEQATQSLRLDAIEAKQDAIINGSDYFAISAYANLNNIPVDNKRASALGKAATHYCMDNAISMGQATHPLWGSVHTYPRYVLDIIFDRFPV